MSLFFIKKGYIAKTRFIQNRDIDYENKINQATQGVRKVVNMTLSNFESNYRTMTKEEVKTFLQEHSTEDLPASVLGRAFERLYIDTRTGHTERNIELMELVALHHSFSLGNGGGWSRSDRGFLGKNYITVNHKISNRITSISTEGFKSNQTVAKFRKIEMSTLWELEDAVDVYECLSAVLNEDSDAIPEEIKEDVALKRDEAADRMYQIAKAITRNLPTQE